MTTFCKGSYALGTACGSCPRCFGEREIRRRCIMTYTGRMVDPVHLTMSDVSIADIAHALSMTCRFTGHVSQFYSVAEHSVWVASLCEKRYKKCALLHDASEAYICDVSKPVKDQPLMKEYVEVESHIMNVIAHRFNVFSLFKNEQTQIAVHNADRKMYLIEARDLMPSSFPNRARVFDLPKIKKTMTPAEAEEKFLKTFNELWA